MAKLIGKASVELAVQLILNESEVNALIMLASYSHTDLIGHLGKFAGSDARKHEAALCSFLESCQRDLGPIVAKMREARAVFVRGVS